MKLTKEEALLKIEELKKYVSEKEKEVEETSKAKLQIKNLMGEVLFESEKTTIKEVVEEAVSKGVNLEGTNLTGANLEDANLKGTNLGGANLTGANLRGTNLGSANLGGTNLTGTNLGSANLTGTNLTGANLEDANLKGAYLRDVDFYQAKFYGKEGTTKIKKNQLDDFLKALGVIVEN